MIRIYFSFGTLLLTAVAILLVWAEPLVPDSWKGKAEAFSVKAFESSGSVVLEWNPRSEPVQSATSGLLEFEDGSSSHRNQVDAKVLRQGALEYRRRSADVFLRLSLLRNAYVIGHASVRLTGAPPVASAAAP